MDRSENGGTTMSNVVNVLRHKLQLGTNVCSNKEYHSDLEWYSSSKLKLLNEDPKEFYEQVILGNSKSESKPQYDLGSYVHTLVLEEHLEHEEFAMFKGWRKAGKDWEAFKADPKHAGKTILSAPQVETGRMLAATVKGRPEALELFKGGLPELSITSHIMGVPVKMRADYINVDKGYIVDLKTTGLPAGIENFRQTCKDFHYDLSAALYAQIAYNHYGKLFDFYFVPISKVDRQCDVYKASSAFLSEGAKQVTSALVTYKKCKETGIWSLPDTHPAAKLVSSDYKIELV